MLTLLANSLWYLLCLPGSLAFHQSLRDVAGTQERLLQALLRHNVETTIGRRYGFATIGSVADYQARAPLSDYADYQAAIERIGAGEVGVLTQDPVLMLELTSGSTAATKYIPYTAALKAEFQRAINPWVADLYRRHPQLFRGQAYWSVTPVTHRHQRTSGGVPIGFEEDSDYLGPLQRRLVQSLLAVPGLVRLIDDMAAFRYVTLLFLLRSRNLALISVWNPTFLTLLVQPLAEWWPQLADDITRGTLSPPAALPGDLYCSLQVMNRPDPVRAAEIRAIFQADPELASVYARLWPRLTLISCWTEAHAALHAPQVARLFPQARLQGKGLLATEGVVSFPLAGQPGHILALRSHFFEFIPAGDDSDLVRPLLAHELEQGQAYEPVLTTGGGLYRYRLHDIVEVVGHLKGCPLFRFAGKTGLISDRFGEKLNEYHVRQALDWLLQRYALRPEFVMVAYEEGGGQSGYMLFIEAPAASDALLSRLAADLELALQENFHYCYCRDLGQLQPLGLFRIDRNGLETYLSVCQAHGQRAGDIKPMALHRLEGWSNYFQGCRMPSS
jgi:hypothetical protein